MEHFVEIEAGAVTYRFFGRGVWKVKDRDGWRTINAIYVPGDVLQVAAAQVRPKLWSGNEAANL